MHTLSHTHTHTSADTSMSSRATDTPMEKNVGCQRCAWNMFWLLWFWLHILKVFTETRRGPWHQCPVIDGTMSRLLKCCKLLRHDGTVRRLDWVKRDKSFQAERLPWHVLCSLLLHVFTRLYRTRPKSSKNESSHMKHLGHCGVVCLSVCSRLSLCIKSILVNHMRYLFWSPLRGRYVRISWND